MLQTPVKLRRLPRVQKCFHHTALQSNSNWKILFFGADNFSNYTLEHLCKTYEETTLISRLEVVTSIKGKPNPVRMLSGKKNLLIHKWPPLLKENEFDVALVVSFGHLIPQDIIKKFPLGMLNVHASLLPRWRGAAPIIHALANGDTETGVTIMKIEPHKFDVGGVISQVKVTINPDMKMPELHKELGQKGAEELIKVIGKLPEVLNNVKPQPLDGVTYAPRVTPSFANINWEKMTSTEIYNLERALTDVYPLTTNWCGSSVKLLDVRPSECSFEDSNKVKPGFVYYDKQSKSLKILCIDRKWISIKRVGVVGKKTMSACDFSNGYLKKVEINGRYFK